MYVYLSGVGFGVVLEYYAAVGLLAAFFVVVGTAVYFPVVLSCDGDMEGYVDAVVVKFGPDVLLQCGNVESSFEWFAACGIEHVDDYFVEQCFLVDVSVAKLLLSSHHVVVGLCASQYKSFRSLCWWCVL